MNILSIETSCDETAISIVEVEGDFPDAKYVIKGNALFSQIAIHREYGGVFPALAKREHAKTLTPLLTQALKEANLLEVGSPTVSKDDAEELHTIFIKEPKLDEILISFFKQYKKPNIDYIAVTTGPGLEPALWVGINFARALGYFWEISIIPVNHMEGHIFSSLFSQTSILPISFPALAVLISGGHTEMVLMKDWTTYNIVGKTRDDAVGEAFDKVARMLGLPYPGGPEISKKAQDAREQNLPPFIRLPRPMINSNDLDFSFSGLKTAVRYAIQNTSLTKTDVASVAREFEDAVTDVLLEKTRRAVERYTIKTVIVGGGVSANTHIKEKFTTFFKATYTDLPIHFPQQKFSTDNSIMIALVGHAHRTRALSYGEFAHIHADGNLSIETAL